MYLSKSLIIGLTNNQTFDKSPIPYYNKFARDIIDKELMIEIGSTIKPIYFIFRKLVIYELNSFIAFFSKVRKINPLYTYYYITKYGDVNVFLKKI